jgi:hypothetical protein
VVASTRTIASAANILGLHSGTIMRRLKRFSQDAGDFKSGRMGSEEAGNGGEDDRAAN